MGDTSLRPRVYVEFAHGRAIMRRVLDLAFLEPNRPIAVISWVQRDGRLQPGSYVELDPALLRPAAPVGTWWYHGLVGDPRAPRPPDAGAE